MRGLRKLIRDVVLVCPSLVLVLALIGCHFLGRIGHGLYHATPPPPVSQHDTPPQGLYNYCLGVERGRFK